MGCSSASVDAATASVAASASNLAFLASGEGDRLGLERADRAGETLSLFTTGDFARTGDPDLLRGEPDLLRTGERDLLRAGERDCLRAGERDLLLAGDRDLLRTGERERLRVAGLAVRLDTFFFESLKRLSIFLLPLTGRESRRSLEISFCRTDMSTFCLYVYLGLEKSRKKRTLGKLKLK